MLYILSALYGVGLLIGISNNLQTSLEISNLFDHDTTGFIQCMLADFSDGLARQDALCRSLIPAAALEKTMAAVERGYDETSRSNPATTMSSIAFALSVRFSTTLFRSAIQRTEK